MPKSCVIYKAGAFLPLTFEASVGTACLRALLPKQRSQKMQGRVILSLLSASNSHLSTHLVIVCCQMGSEPGALYT